MSRLALLSVYDKTGIIDLARQLVELDFELVSTGGTARTLQEAGFAVTPVSQVTGFPEILDGRVKTLHPVIHGGILARATPEHQEQLDRHGIRRIELVVVNLYPFEATITREKVSLEEVIENIDIGGPTMVRAAAKNHEATTVVVNPVRYPEVLAELRQQGTVGSELRLVLAVEAFRHTARYDSLVGNYLAEAAGQRDFPLEFTLGGRLAQALRYGENPHQKAAFYRQGGVKGATLAAARQLQGKELSFNNLVDAEAALALVREFAGPAAVIIKHTNPCGVAVAADLAGAYQKAFAADPVSAFGGIVGVNRAVDAAAAALMVKTFLEVIVAPDFEPEALAVLKGKENIRLLAVGELDGLGANDRWDVKKVSGGFLVQDRDLVTVTAADLRCVTRRRPAAAEVEELLFAWKVVKHVKSNAIVVSKDGASLGVGAGQMNRVGAASLALEQAGSRAGGAVLASDAFFPFRDTVDEAARAGITAIIQPGGSVKDDESIQACDEHGLAMVFTGVRHFKH